MNRGIHPAALVAAYGLLALAPLLFAAARLRAGADPVRELAIAAGLLSLSLLLLQFASSGRYEVLSRRAGIDRTMRWHQLAARAVVALALLHPLLFIVPYNLEELREFPAMVAILFTAPHLASGVAAWVLLLAMVAMGIWRDRLPLRYEPWRATHALAAVLAAGGGIHHAVAAGTYSSGAWLAGYWGVLGALAFGTLAYLYLAKPWMLVRTAHHVVSNREIGHGIREI
ncbi:MAG TPA: ferric reductase-like transmembrane domain-containing protein, partial [Myxococcota bacterium]|nr:ferric reductase-like transmembrane domain-containing protein [Myxococcota bacterium]